MEKLACVDKSIAVYAFSADPITNGHINIVERVAASFSKCIVGIGKNPMKSYMFDLETRKALAEQSLTHLSNVEVVSFEGMVVDFAYEHGANVIVKGIRSAADVEYEQILHQVGVSQNMGIDTHLLFADPELAHVSSSVVKAMQSENGFIQDYVPPIVKAALEAKISNQLIIGLTGDIAVGKSALADKLVDEGKRAEIEVHNIDLDKLGHQVLAGEGIGEPMHREVINSIVKLAGPSVLENGAIERKILAEKVFSDPKLLVEFNELMMKPVAILLRRSLKGRKGIILLNGALIADMNLLGLCNNRCVLCDVETEEQRRRLSLRGLNDIEIASRLRSQANGAEKKQMIRSSIKSKGFGMLWSYLSEEDDAESLLETIVRDCEMYQWIN